MYLLLSSSRFLFIKYFLYNLPYIEFYIFNIILLIALGGSYYYYYLQLIDEVQRIRYLLKITDR